jgi:hypothetical protein
MRSTHLYTIGAIGIVLLVGLGAKWLLFPNQNAPALTIGSMNVLEMHHANMPEQKVHDMTFVFPAEK